MKPTDDRARMWRLAARYSTVGIEMAAGLTIGTLGGRWLDEKLGTEPYLMWFGIVVGLGTAVKAVVRVVKKTDFDNL